MKKILINVLSTEHEKSTTFNDVRIGFSPSIFDQVFHLKITKNEQKTLTNKG